MRFWSLYLALACVAVLAVLQALVRLRLRKVEEQSRPFQGGLFNHGKYLRLRRRHHWSGWPVYLIWMFWLAGIVLMLWNLLYHTVPRHTGF
jgi:predicted membrane channel-forming protein YqfA (hemolysin III family)